MTQNRIGYLKRNKTIDLVKESEPSKLVNFVIPMGYDFLDCRFQERVPLDFPAQEGEEVVMSGNPENYVLIDGGLK